PSPADPTTGSAVYDPASKPTLGTLHDALPISTDNAGNSETVNTSAAAQVDKTAPSTTDNVPAGFVNHDVSVTLTASDTGGSGVEDRNITRGKSRHLLTTDAAFWYQTKSPTSGK